MTDIPEPVARPTEFTVSCVPEGVLDSDSFDVTVAYRGGDKWAVLHFGYCYDVDGVREYERIPSGREDEFLARFRFDLETAIAIAKAVAPTIRVNGWTVADALAHENSEASPK